MRYRRRRECGNGHRFTTEEIVVPPEQIKAERTVRLKTARENKAIAKKYQPPKEYSL
jgi:transcriptional regulator NrdR family protein